MLVSVVRFFRRAVGSLEQPLLTSVMYELENRIFALPVILFLEYITGEVPLLCSYDSLLPLHAAKLRHTTRRGYTGLSIQLFLLVSNFLKVVV